jgi:threonine/homoserine efflux transporter RhtA
MRKLSKVVCAVIGLAAAVFILTRHCCIDTLSFVTTFISIFPVVIWLVYIFLQKSHGETRFFYREAFITLAYCAAVFFSVVWPLIVSDAQVGIYVILAPMVVIISTPIIWAMDLILMQIKRKKHLSPGHALPTRVDKAQPGLRR